MFKILMDLKKGLKVRVILHYSLKAYMNFHEFRLTEVRIYYYVPFSRTQ